jgi:hypothetical protein
MLAQSVVLAALVLAGYAAYTELSRRPDKKLLRTDQAHAIHSLGAPVTHPGTVNATHIARTDAEEAALVRQLLSVS